MTMPAAKKVARAILYGLYEGRYAPGQRLIEPDLMAEFGLGRSSIREALRHLEADGVVEILPHKGAQIRKLSPIEAQDSFLVLERCLGLAARQAAQRIDQNDNRARLAELSQMLTGSGPDAPQERLRLRNGFYRDLVALSGNRDLARMLPGLQVHVLRQGVTLPWDKRLANYRRICAAIARSDGSGAEQALCDHLRQSADDPAARRA